MNKTKSRRTASRAPAPLRLAEPLEQVGRTHVLVGRRRLIYFAGCDYFRLASHPEVLAAIRAGLERGNINVAASRKTTGNHRLYEELEGALKSFFGVASATLSSNGYMSNLCVTQALSGDISHALLDERAHGSLADAAHLLGCPVKTFRHRDPNDLRRLVQQRRRGDRVLVLTDGLFAHSGEVAPLADYLSVLPRTARILVDDAHGAGILGRRGRGTPEHLGIGHERTQIIQTITLSKAFGVYGGAILGSKELRRRIIERSRVFVGNTPLPLPLANGALAAVRVVRNNPRLRRRLVFNTAFVKLALRQANFAINDGPGPIIAIHPRTESAAAKLRSALRQSGIHPPWIQYQGGPRAAYFRFAISCEHDGPQLDALVRTLTHWGETHHGKS